METPALFELRGYRAEPGRRDALIEMFETKFLDAYRAGGALVIGAALSGLAPITRGASP